MQPVNCEEVLNSVLAKDQRYARESYLFVRDALDHTQRTLSKKTGKTELRHVTGKELLDGIRDYALQQFGPLAMMVLEEWRVRRCEDFGEIVFNMVESGLLAKTENDTRDDFKSHYDFFDAFRRPFLPSHKVAHSPVEAASQRA